jgi:Raf kinase inhibitor-like YbhB/YbcL family protein
MRLRALTGLLIVGLASCGPTDSPKGAKQGWAVENATLPKLSLTSDAFRGGQPIPMQYTCDGANQTPTLRWSDPPAGTKSFALIIDDPDAPKGTFRHWGVFDFPASARSIGGDKRVGTEVANDKGSQGYTGPCPPLGDKPHHYHFRLFALDTDKLGVGQSAKIIDVENAARQHALAVGELIGTYQRR